MEIKFDTYIDIKPWCVTLQEAINHTPGLKAHLDENNRLDFGDTNAIRAYNQTVAEVLGKLKIEVPEGFLIPTVCLRYSYVKIISDQLNGNSHVLEIGTGASSIISLFLARFGHTVSATEINEISIGAARANIDRNNLKDKIQLIKSNGGILRGVLERKSYDALLVYPPTYNTSQQDKNKINKKRGFKGQETELYGGGEDGFEFTKKLLLESISEPFQIRLISVLTLDAKHVSRSTAILEQAGRSVEIIKLKAGTRIRYVVTGLSE